MMLVDPIISAAEIGDATSHALKTTDPAVADEIAHPSSHLASGLFQAAW